MERGRQHRRELLAPKPGRHKYHRRNRLRQHPRIETPSVELPCHLPLTGLKWGDGDLQDSKAWSHRTTPLAWLMENHIPLFDCHVADKPSGWLGCHSSSRSVPSYALTRRPQSALLQLDLSLQRLPRLAQQLFQHALRKIACGLCCRLPYQLKAPAHLLHLTLAMTRLTALLKLLSWSSTWDNHAHNVTTGV